MQQNHDLGICCSYDEVLRFKASAAVAASNETQLTSIQSSGMGLVQAIADNFDANITSPNGLKSTHALAIPMTQVCRNTEEGQEDTTIIYITWYISLLLPWPKKSQMPEEVSKKCVLPLKVLAQQIILVQRSKFHDFDFLRSVATKPSTPEFGGFNTKFARMQGQGLKPHTKATYTPLIDMTPSDPTTMKIAMLEAKRLTKKAGQATTLFTADLQLYHVGLNVQWAYPELFGEDFMGVCTF